MQRFIDRYLSFGGRLARLPFFARGVMIGILAAALCIVSIPLFAGGGVLWWIGLADVIAGLAFLAVGAVSLMVRRLHDLGFSGYHAFWAGPAELGWAFLSHAPPQMVLVGLPLAAIGLWIAFWPGNAEDNRFGARPG